MKHHEQASFFIGCARRERSRRNGQGALFSDGSFCMLGAFANLPRRAARLGGGKSMRSAQFTPGRVPRSPFTRDERQRPRESPGRLIYSTSCARGRRNGADRTKSRILRAVRQIYVSLARQTDKRPGCMT